MAERIANEAELGFFGRYLTLWVALCMAAGVMIGIYIPIVPAILAKFEFANVSIPVAVLIWLMIYPMMLKIDFSSVVGAVKMPKGLIVTCTTNWLIKPFTMYGIAAFFLFVLYKGMISPNWRRNISPEPYSWAQRPAPPWSSCEPPHKGKSCLHSRPGSGQRSDNTLRVLLP